MTIPLQGMQGNEHYLSETILYSAAVATIATRQLHTGQATSLWSSSTGFTGTIRVLRVGRCLTILLIWNLHFESLHLQLIFPKGKCLCIWLLMNEEKYVSLVIKKAKPLSTTLAVNVSPAPLPPCYRPSKPAHQHAVPCPRRYNCNSRTRWGLETL